MKLRSGGVGIAKAPAARGDKHDSDPFLENLALDQQQEWRKSLALTRFSTRIADRSSIDRDFLACPLCFPVVPSE